MDGNGRWAELQGLPRSKGHARGAESVRGVVRACVNENIQTLSLFAFGQDNWQRPKDEVDCLMQLLFDSLTKEVEELHQEGVRLSFLGNTSELDDALQTLIASVEQLTAANTKLNLNIFISYSGRWDLTHAFKQLAHQVQNQTLSPDDITEATISDALVTRGFEDPDLFIRTSGEQRISNFFLWQLVYSEMYFTDVLWPDFTPLVFQEALDWFSHRQRRFGKTSKQLDKAEHA